LFLVTIMILLARNAIQTFTFYVYVSVLNCLINRIQMKKFKQTILINEFMLNMLPVSVE